MVTHCACGFPVSRRTSWTHENLGRKFVACKFFNHETGQRGCHTFEWIDEGMIEWQREVTNQLVAEKHRLAHTNNILEARLVCEKYEKDRLADEKERLVGEKCVLAAKLEKMKEKKQNNVVASKQMALGEKKPSVVRSSGVFNNISVCV